MTKMRDSIQDHVELMGDMHRNTVQNDVCSSRPSCQRMQQ